MKNSKNSMFQPAKIRKLFGTLLAIAAMALWLSSCSNSPFNPGGGNEPTPTAYVSPTGSSGLSACWLIRLDQKSTSGRLRQSVFRNND